MKHARYQVSINGFSITKETYDDMLQYDGKRDEVFIAWVTSKSKGDRLIYTGDGRSATMGDANGNPGRIQAGSASNRGGLRTGDRFPHNEPWKKSNDIASPAPDRNYPPMVIWDGDLAEDEALIITPVLYEWDLGAGVPQRLIEWHALIDEKFGAQAKEVFSKINAGVGVIFDAVSLGIQTAKYFTEITGTAGTRPIGMEAGESPNTYRYRPRIIGLTMANVEEFIADDATGKGKGVSMFQLTDATALEGDYDLYWQIERIGDIQGSADPVPISPQFDVQFYLATYPDLKAAYGTDFQAALNHWVNQGLPAEGRRGSREFDVQFYLATYPDLKAAYGTDFRAALDHWVNQGLPNEGRKGAP